MNIKLAVPSKGRLQEDSFAWFQSRGLRLERTGSAREYAGRVEGIDGVDLVLLSAGEIPKALENGDIHFGVTGQDLIQEKLFFWQDKVEEVALMGFGFADLILAIPDFWVDVRTLDDLDAVAAQFRNDHGLRLRIATKYHRLVHQFLRDAQVANTQLIDSQGATEGTVANQKAEAVADITSSGETLRANHLRVLDDGLILRSQATLFASKSHNFGESECQKMTEVREFIAAHSA